MQMRALHPAISIAAVIAFTISTAAAPQNNSSAPSRAQTAPKPAIAAAASSNASASSTAAPSATANETTAAKLPVRRVVLYKNGVGYFEHLGRVRGSQDVHIDFTSAQLNDVLKSLTVLDLNGGRITGVDYNSEAPHRSPPRHTAPRARANARASRNFSALSAARASKFAVRQAPPSPEDC